MSVQALLGVQLGLEKLRIGAEIYDRHGHLIRSLQPRIDQVPCVSIDYHQVLDRCNLSRRESLRLTHSGYCISVSWRGRKQQLQVLRWLLFHTATLRILDRTSDGHLLDCLSLGTWSFQTIESTTVASCVLLNVWLVTGAWTVEGSITSTAVGRYLKKWGTLIGSFRLVSEPAIDSGRWKVYITRATSLGLWTTSFGLTQRPCNKDVVQLLPHRSSSNLLEWLATGPSCVESPNRGPP